MLLKIAIDPDAGHEIAEGVKGPGKLLVRRLRERCLLVAESSASVRDLQEAFRDARSAELNQVIALLIQHRLQLLTSSTASGPPTPLREIESLDQVESWRNIADLLLISKWRAEWLSLAEEATVPEVASLRDAFNSEAFARVESQGKQLIPSGKNREDVWQEVFAPLAAHTTRVYIIDGWLAVNLYRGLNARTRSRAKSGAEWFLGHLARTRVRFIHLACSERDVREANLDPERVQGTIADWFAGLNSGTELELRILSGDFQHARGIAFDAWAGFELHKGLASLDGPQLREHLTLNASLELASDVRAKYRALQ